MALVYGTNCGLVAAAPSSDPNGGAGVDTVDDRMVALKIATTSAGTISEIGWWCNNATEAANFEVAVYSHDAVNDVPDTIVSVSRTNAKGTTAGWKAVTGLNISLSASTTYWLALQVDNTATTTNTDYESSVPRRTAYKLSQTTLADDYSDASATPEYMFGIYAVFTASGGAEATNTWINIGDTWKLTSAEYINIGDAWKPIVDKYINISDVWKKVN